MSHEKRNAGARRKIRVKYITMNNDLLIIKKLRSLPPEKQSEALDFIDFLCHRNPAPKINSRPYGLSQNLFQAPEGFDDPLPEDILNDFGV